MTDWVDYKTGECLTGYEPAKHARTLIEKMERMADESSPPQDWRQATPNVHLPLSIFPLPES